MLVEKVKGAPRLAAVSPGAAAAGLQPGLALADARARIPSLKVEAYDPHSDTRMLERLAADCERFSPIVAIKGLDSLLLDIGGCAHLFAGEIPLRQAVGRRFRRFGFHVRATIADSPDAAAALVRYGRIAIVPEGEDTAHVRRLPVVALGLSEDTRVALVRAGLRTVGDLLDRPTPPLSARFAEDIARRLARLCGREPSPVSPRRPAPLYITEQRFAEPVARIDDIRMTLQGLLREMAGLLQERLQGGRIFEASFFRADGAVRRICIETGRPLREPAPLMRLFHEKLDALADPLDPGFGFDMVRLSALAAEPLASNQISLDGRMQDDSEIAGLLERLSARFGRDRVLRFLPEDTHDPARAVRLRPALEETGEAWPAPEAGEPPLRPIQLFDPPQPIAPAAAEAPDGPPASFIWRRVVHRIVRSEGPERIAPEWWREDVAGQTRDYFRLEDAEGRRFWVFRTGEYGAGEGVPRWYVHGLFA